MIGMALSNEMAEGTVLGSSQDNNGPKYPAGLEITLDNDSLKRLALSPPQVGDVFQMEGLVEVVSVTKQDGQIEDGHVVRLQITTMGLEAPEDERNEQQQAYDKLTRMYGND
jgi:hypothetical protein